MSDYFSELIHYEVKTSEGSIYVSINANKYDFEELLRHYYEDDKIRLHLLDYLRVNGYTAKECEAEDLRKIKDVIDISDINIDFE
jgi:hypothetical protein